MMYPRGYQTYITVEQVSQGKEGGSRPGHFRGVATVVAKLFNLAQPDFAYFGQKDAQQVAVLRRMVTDLNVPLEMIVCPIVREADGLAMSSRNVYLHEAERQAASVLYRSMQHAAALYDAGERHPEVLRESVLALLRSEPLAEPDYVSVASAATLQELSEPSNDPLLLSLAVKIGKPRLLDNCLLPMHLNNRVDVTRVLGAG
jgi:pantoate--beta-alanine ligase